MPNSNRFEILYGCSPIRPQAFEQHSKSRMQISFVFLQIWNETARIRVKFLE